MSVGTIVIHSFNKYLFSTYCVPVIIYKYLKYGSDQNKIKSLSCGTHVLAREMDKNQGASLVKTDVIYFTLVRAGGMSGRMGREE